MDRVVLAMFKNLLHGKWERWNSNHEARHYDEKYPSVVSKGASGNLLNFAKMKYRADYMYGGWAEDRSYVLRDTYLKPSKFIHLGNDYFIPEDTIVLADTHLMIIQVYCDTPEKHGWGTRIMGRIPGTDITLVYGHLSKFDHVKVGDNLKPGDKIGRLGNYNENGGWSPHLHVQAIRGDIDEYLHNPELLDGYGELLEREELILKFPDPSEWFKMDSVNDDSEYLEPCPFCGFMPAVDKDPIHGPIDIGYCGKCTKTNEYMIMSKYEVIYYKQIGRL